jgi:hypothetical protein
MAILTAQALNIDGLAATLTSAAAGGDKFANPSDERTFLRVTNGSGASINVTITKQVAAVNAPGYGSVATADKVVAVAAGASKDIGPFPTALWNDAQNMVNVAYSAVTTVTVGVIRMARAS